MSDDTIWVVSSGVYSDYRVLCACPSKRDADAVAKKMRGGSGWRSHNEIRVESLPIVSASVEEVSILRISENLWDDGTAGDYNERVSIEWPFDTLYGDARPVSWRWVRAPVHRGKGGRIEVGGTDHERVRRVYSERKALVRTDDAFRAKREATSR